MESWRLHILAYFEIGFRVRYPHDTLDEEGYNSFYVSPPYVLQVLTPIITLRNFHGKIRKNSSSCSYQKGKGRGPCATC